ncbi:MAG: dihydroorotase [Proteobacteria bacterium]|nr:dihydroorotase [Pseudomonadota bacterium]
MSVITSIKSDSFVVKNVSVWNVEEILTAVDVYVNLGIITDIQPHDSQRKKNAYMEKMIDGTGLTLIPAGVDAQVHLRVPGQVQKETAKSGLQAAIHGGVGALLTMPNTKPVLDCTRSAELAYQELKDAEVSTGVRVLLSSAITVGQRGRELVDFEGMKHVGVAAFTDDGVGIQDDQIMLDALRSAARVGLPLLQHAEVPGHGGVLHECKTQRSLGGVAYPKSAEIDMVARDLRLLEQVPEARYHVLHVSCLETLDLIDRAVAGGYKVTCEVSPHHLYFCADDIPKDLTAFKMNPPLRSAEDQLALIQGLGSGRIQFMATDHAPHEAEVKGFNFKTSAFGTTGLETSLRVLLALWRRGHLTISRLVEVWATAPAKFLGISQNYGSLKVGRPCNATLVDVMAPDRVVMSFDMVGLSKNNCFIGTHLPGEIRATILGSIIHTLK